MQKLISQESILQHATMLALTDELARHLQGQPLELIANDRRFADTIYRVARASGLMDRVEYRDVSSGVD